MNVPESHRSSNQKGIVLLLLTASYPASFSFSPLARQSVFRPLSRQHRLPPAVGWCARNPAYETVLYASGGDDDSKGDAEGMNLAAEFFKAAKGMGIDSTGLDDEEEEEDDEEDEEEEEEVAVTKGGEDEPRKISISEVNLFKGRDEGGVGKLAGNVTFTNKELYNTLKERVLESPSAFRKLVGGKEDDSDDTENKEAYTPPSTYPDSGLTAGEVVTTVLDALVHNDVPAENEGIRVFFGYASHASVIKSKNAPTVEEYSDFLKTSDYKALLEHTQVIIDKADYSYDKKKAYFTVRLKKESALRDFTSVNFILSTTGSGENDCWLIDSILIRDGMRKRR